MLHPNPPRLVTVGLALALVVVGISATIFPLDIANAAIDVVQGAVGTQIEITEQVGWLFLLVGDGLLVAGSLLPDI